MRAPDRPTAPEARRPAGGAGEGLGRHDCEACGPTTSSAGHVENAIVPPGLQDTRSISAIATSGRGANM